MFVKYIGRMKLNCMWVSHTTKNHSDKIFLSKKYIALLCTTTSWGAVFQTFFCLCSAKYPRIIGQVNIPTFSFTDLTLNLRLQEVRFETCGKLSSLIRTKRLIIMNLFVILVSRRNQQHSQMPKSALRNMVMPTSWYDQGNWTVLRIWYKTILDQRYTAQSSNNVENNQCVNVLTAINRAGVC